MMGTQKKINYDIIKNQISDSSVIFERGKNIYENGNFILKNKNFDDHQYSYFFDGNYGDYDVHLNFKKDQFDYTCNCPYPGTGCKHIVAASLDVLSMLQDKLNDNHQFDQAESKLTIDDFKEMALNERKRSAKKEHYKITWGDTAKGDHLLETEKKRQYKIIVHDPLHSKGFCSCIDFATNKLETCKHLVYFFEKLNKKIKNKEYYDQEVFPFAHVYWDSVSQRPKIYFETKVFSNKQIKLFNSYFNSDGLLVSDDITTICQLMKDFKNSKQLIIDHRVFEKIDQIYFDQEIHHAQNKFLPLDFSIISANLYEYQKRGVNHFVFERSGILADEMGLGKTIQAITIALFKKKFFGFSKILVVCPASLKDQWKKEIGAFSKESAVVIEGSKENRQKQYIHDESFFKITNYEAVLRDVLTIQRYQPDFIILDEAQRIKNYETKTASVIKSLPKKHSLVITGTPLENKLEDLYSIMQFVNPDVFNPLWEFSANHYMIEDLDKFKVTGYCNLNVIHQKMKPYILRRKKEDVLKDLPQKIVNEYYITLSDEQYKIHAGFASSLLPILNKKFITPMDMQRIQQLLMSMRRVCDSTYLIDRQTNISPKLDELKNLLKEIVLCNKRKLIIFSEWTTMTFLIGKLLSNLNISFVEFSGKIQVKKREALVSEFKENPECMVFIATDAAQVGLNLQNADYLINFELPWNPAKLNQRIGRIHRIGQKSKVINVINFISKFTIEERIYAGIQLKQELFDGVFDGSQDAVEFSQEKKAEFINSLRSMFQDEHFSSASESLIQDELIIDKDLIEIQEELDEDQGSCDVLDSPRETNMLQESCNNRVSEETGKPVESQTRNIETVLNDGLNFLNGLIQMSGGPSLLKNDSKPSITVNDQTGEININLKIPDFQKKQ